MIPEQVTTDCRLCGKQTPMLGTKLCDRCWELETRIQDSPAIARRVLAAMESDSKEPPTPMIPEIVKRAMTETVTDIGQLSKSELYQLNKAVKRGWLSKGKGGPFPKLKTVYALPNHDFVRERNEWVDYMMAIAETEQRQREESRRCPTP